MSRRSSFIPTQFQKINILQSGSTTITKGAGQQFGSATIPITTEKNYFVQAYLEDGENTHPLEYVVLDTSTGIPREDSNVNVNNQELLITFQVFTASLQAQLLTRSYTYYVIELALSR